MVQQATTWNVGAGDSVASRMDLATTPEPEQEWEREREQEQKQKLSSAEQSLQAHRATDTAALDDSHPFRLPVTQHVSRVIPSLYRVQNAHFQKCHSYWFSMGKQR